MFFGIFLENVYLLTLPVDNHQFALVAVIDAVNGAVFVFEFTMRRIEGNLFLWEFEFEL